MADEAALARLRRGVSSTTARRCPRARAPSRCPPGSGERDPPIRVRRAIPTAWIELELREGRNRQVRRMTAAVGLPTLRLVRHRIGPWNLDGLAPGHWRDVPPPSPDALREHGARGA